MSLLVLLSLLASSLDAEEPTPGYLTYCPCMGRFGNQADQLLGSMALAKALGRTLVLPPWVEYVMGRRTPRLVPWDTYFNLSMIQQHGATITMEEFMADSGPGPRVWPKEQRAAFCYSARQGKQEASCNAKEGSPFGPFWDHFNISFPQSVQYSPLHYDTHNPTTASSWTKTFPISRYPVLAFTGAPAAFPVQKENVELQRFVVWNSGWEERSRRWVVSHLPNGPFLGLHLRNGKDWERACEHVESGMSHLFASPQCLGYRNERGELNKELCLPSLSTVVRQVRKAAKEVKAVSVFVASDSDYLLDGLRKEFHRSGLTFHRQEAVASEVDPHLDLAILGRSNLFIGNCVSSFSAFVKRSRDVLGLPSHFWGFPKIVGKKRKSHEEL